MMRKQISSTRRMAESGIMIAVALVLSVMPLFEMPYGGSITACSALPLLIIAYRHGSFWGIFSGIVYGLIQMFLGMKNVLYFTTPLSIIAVILLDYLVAFAVLGLGGIFKRISKTQSAAFGWGALLVGALRYLCHVIAGCTVWAGLSIPTAGAFVYSLAYNATYMIPETLITVMGAVYVSRYLDFSGMDLRRRNLAEATKNSAYDSSLVGYTALLVAAIWDVILVFSKLQDAESGEFLLQGLSRVNWLTFGIVSACGVGIFLITRLLAKKTKEKN